MEYLRHFQSNYVRNTGVTFLGLASMLGAAAGISVLRELGIRGEEYNTAAVIVNGVGAFVGLGGIIFAGYSKISLKMVNQEIERRLTSFEVPMDN